MRFTRSRRSPPLLQSALAATLGMLPCMQSAALTAVHAADLLPHAITQCALPSNPDSGIKRRSVYVPVADGTRLAVDIFLPRSLAPTARIPTLYTATRYW